MQKERDCPIHGDLSLGQLMRIVIAGCYRHLVGGAEGYKRESKKNKPGFRAADQVGRLASASEGEGDGTRRRSAWVLTAAEGRAVPGPWSGRGESRTSDGTHQRPSWGGEVAGARGSGLEGSRTCSRMAWAVEERRTTATTRRVPPQRGQARTSVWNVRLRSSAQGMGWRGRRGPDRLRRHGAGSCLGGRRKGRMRRHDAGTQPGVGDEDLEVADAGWPWVWDERGHPAEEGHWRQYPAELMERYRRQRNHR